MACLLAASAGYWVLGRGTPRPTGTWAVGALLASFSLAFLSYAPLVSSAVEAAIPHSARLVSNSASLTAATSVLAISYQVNREAAEARRRIRSQIVVLTVLICGMTALFAYEQMTRPSPRVHALYLLLFIGYLGFAVIGFLRQIVLQSKASRLHIVRVGLRLAAVGCLFALIYTAYKTTVIISLGLGLDLISRHAPCSSLVSFPCVFSVTSPALAVTLICLGLTLPAVVYPIGQARRRRWEIRSFEALGPLWHDLSTAMPEIVLSAADAGREASGDSDFLLQRRVIEINDGILALRPYCTTNVRRAAQRTVDAGTEQGAALVEAVVIRAALTALRSGHLVGEVFSPSTEEVCSRAGDLRAEALWLLQVSDAYAHRRVALTADGQPKPIGA
ncbi:MAB_1171c family putative transporter [Streptomyces sp. NPDC004838]